MIEIPPGADCLDLDGDDTTDEQLANAVEATDEATTDRPFMYADAEEWLQKFALPRYLRKLGSNRKWAPNRYDYPEAYSLITALWESREQMRWDGPQQILVFYRDYFYTLMDRLAALDGPFHAYDKTTHPEPPEMYPVWDRLTGRSQVAIRTSPLRDCADFGSKEWVLGGNGTETRNGPLLLGRPWASRRARAVCQRSRLLGVQPFPQTQGNLWI